jgi:hypothetical protein
VSVAVSATETVAAYQPVEQALPLHVAVVAGGVPSTCTSCDFAPSALPRLSTEKNLTVAVPGSENGPVYLVLEVVGVLPSVV